MSQTAATARVYDAAEAGTARTIYILYLVGLIFPLMPLIVLVGARAVTPTVGWVIIAYALTPIIGLILAYIERTEAPSWVQSHYQMQIRTCWLGLLYGIVAAATIYFYIGILVALFTLVWWIVRCVKGLKATANGTSYDYPEHYVW